MQTQEYHELDKIHGIEQLDRCESLEQAKQWFLSRKPLKHHHKWALPQLVAKLRQWQLVTRDNRVLAKETLRKNLEDPKQRRYYWLWQVPRSCWIGKQIEHTQYAQLTPLLLLAHKQEYSYQSWQGLECLEPWLHEACNLDQQQRVQLEELLHGPQLLELYHRSLGGKPAKSQAKTYKLQEIPLPKNTLVLLFQHWLACPSIRHQDQILDPLNWDNMPKPIVQPEPCAGTTQHHTKAWLPWD